MSGPRSQQSEERIEVTRTRHGPFERIVLTAHRGSSVNSLSVYRVGDLLIDGGGSRVAAQLVEALREDPPKRILCTHQHEDHVGGIATLRRAFGPLPVYIAKAYVDLVATFDRVPAYRAAAWGTPEPVADAIGFSPGGEFEAGGTRLRALETPGHTPFHITFVAHEDAQTYALTGDLYTSSPQLAWFESSAEDLVRSCRQVAGESERLCLLPTHGRAREAGGAALSGLADQVEREAERVRTAHQERAPCSHRELARLLYGDADAVMSAHSQGEFAHANFVRAVLAPVKALPATPAL
jgi:glyoxylase-like metal-dependent hydrolase (beta-lactamase superfamily II)